MEHDQQEFLVVHDPEICSLDGVVGVEGVRDPMLVVIVCTWSYLDFLLHDRHGPEEAELLHCVLDLGQGSPGCWQH
jgi:hypothetical protein